MRLFSRFRSSGSAVAVGRVRDRTTSSARTSPARAAAPPRPSVFLLSCLSVCLSVCLPARPQRAPPPSTRAASRLPSAGPEVPKVPNPPNVPNDPTAPGGEGYPLPHPGGGPGEGPEGAPAGKVGKFSSILYPTGGAYGPPKGVAFIIFAVGRLPHFIPRFHGRRGFCEPRPRRPIRFSPGRGRQVRLPARNDTASAFL